MTRLSIRRLPHWLGQGFHGNSWPLLSTVSDRLVSSISIHDCINTGHQQTDRRCVHSSTRTNKDESETNPSSSAPEGESETTGTDQASTAEKEQTPGEIARQGAEYWVAKGFTPRQAAWLSPDPDKARKPRLTRKEAGSYGRPDMVAEYVREVQDGFMLPEGVSMYNLDEAIPEIMEPKCPEFDMMMSIREQNPDVSVIDAARMVGLDIPESIMEQEEQLLREEKEGVPHVYWTYRNVLTPATIGEEHPVNKKVKCEFRLKTLQEVHGLSDEGAEYIALICDKRYNPKTGMVTLVSDTCPDRQGNTERIEKIIKDLVVEGKRVGQKQRAS